VSEPLDREQLRLDLSDALKAVQRADDVTGLDVLTASRTTLEPVYSLARPRTTRSSPPAREDEVLQRRGGGQER
jgi:hypothetical protein